jgi:hypothetical protein
VIIGALLMQLAGGWAGAASLVVLAFLALVSAEWAIKAAALGGLINLLNPEIFGASEYSLGLRWVLLGAVVLRGVTTVWIVRDGSLPMWLRPLLIFALLSLAGSAIASFDFRVSLLSMLAFTAGFAGLRLAFDHTRRPLASWFHILFLIIVVSSTPLIWRPEGYASNERGFQGILYSPQAFGVLLAPFAAWLLVRVVLAPSRRGLRDVPLLALVLWLIYLSGARVAGLAIGLGLLAALSGLFVRAIRAKIYRRQIFATAAGAGILGVAALVGLQSGRAREVLVEFVSKAGTADITSVGGIVESRRELIERSWENFLSKPITGIGFGLPSDPSMLRVEEVGGWPISAVREKGFLLSAVLEESGIFGAAALVAFLVALARTVARQRNIENSALFWAAFFTNFGEMVLFSPGGVGIYVWLMLGLAATPFGQGARAAIVPEGERRHGRTRGIASEQGR